MGKTKKESKKHLKFFQKLPAFLISFYKKTLFLLRLFIITTIAIVIGIAIIITNTDPNKYKEDITISIEKFTDKKVEIKGDLKWNFSTFEPKIKIEQLYIDNSSWGKNEYLITADNIMATISLKDLFKRKISLDSLIVDNSKIYLEVSSLGNRNWRLSEERKQKIKEEKEIKSNTSNKSHFAFDIKTIRINNAEIFYDNRQSKIKENIKLNELLITSNDYSSPIFLGIETIYKGAKFTGDFKTNSLKDLIADSSNIPLTGILNLNDIEIKFAGKLSNVYKNGALSSTLFISAPNLQKSLSPFITTRQFAPTSAEIELIATPTFISLKKINLKYLTAQITGTSEITLKKGEKPNIKANLHMPFLDIPNVFYPNWEKDYFDRLATGKEKIKIKKKKIENPKAFRNIPLPVKELDWLNFNIKLSIDKLKAMPEMEVNKINLNAILNDGNGIISPLSFNYMGGNVDIDIIADNKNNTFNGQVGIKAEDINLGQTIDSTGYKDVFKGGDVDIDIILSGKGQNLETFMKNLNGYIKAYTTTKTIGYKIENILMATDLVSSIFKFISKDIVGSITGKDKKVETSNFQCMVVNLNIKDGQTTSNRGIAIQTDAANIIIDGSANLGNEYIDVSIITVVKEGFKLSSGLTEMIRIQGAMASPEIIISKDGLINTVAKTAFTTAILGTLTGGITLATTGLGLFTKSWLNNIQADDNPCKTAFEGKVEGQPTEDFDNQIIIKEKLEENINKEKTTLNKITTKKIEQEKQKIKSKN